ncbi:MAG: peptide ABC transporter ATP-binding protein [Candidatus Marinimicrobia bacterium]|nr:peptide ABC transporter ATP-binding protein [Candidatus Neomarinimicrobiota bacterium]
MSNNKLIEVKNLKTYFQTEAGVAKAVNDVSFDIYKGEVLGIVGESGSGKSVTSLSINRLIPNPPGEIVSGEVIYNGVNLLDLSYEEMSQYRGKHISMIFQEPMTSLNPVLRVKTQMNEILIHHDKLTEEEATKKSIEILNSVGIPDPEIRINDYPHQFSGGMRQRIMIAMALQCNPALLIADEPTTALDVTIQAQILDLMMGLKNKREDAAILLITHDLAVVAETCDRVIVMYGGVIQEIADIHELFNNPVHPYTKALMESIPKMNESTKRLKALKGMVPSIIEMGDGCKLCSRFDADECACSGTGIEPDLIEIKENHFARVKPEILQ